MESSKYLSEFNLTEKQLKQFEDYLLLLQEWSKKMNLTTITEETEAYIKHFYDSLALSKYLIRQSLANKKESRSSLSKLVLI